MMPGIYEVSLRLKGKGFTGRYPKRSSPMRMTPSPEAGVVEHVIYGKGEAFMPTKAPSKKKSTAKKKKKTKQAQGTTANAWREEEEAERETLEFIQAVDRYKRRTQKAFPSWTEILEILKSLGYEKVKK